MNYTKKMIFKALIDFDISHAEFTLVRDKSKTQNRRIKSVEIIKRCYHVA